MTKEKMNQILNVLKDKAKLVNRVISIEITDSDIYFDLILNWSDLGLIENPETKEEILLNFIKKNVAYYGSQSINGGPYEDVIRFVLTLDNPNYNLVLDWLFNKEN